MMCYVDTYDNLHVEVRGNFLDWFSPAAAVVTVGLDLGVKC